MRRLPIVQIGAVSFMLSITAIGNSFAASTVVESAKADCTVGERIDGYIGVVDGASASQVVLREIRAINQQRKAAYTDLARRNGVTIDDAAMLTAERLINDAPSGHCVQNTNGGWVEK